MLCVDDHRADLREGHGFFISKAKVKVCFRQQPQASDAPRPVLIGSHSRVA
jgi:hypothetical protein